MRKLSSNARPTYRIDVSWQDDDSGEDSSEQDSDQSLSDKISSIRNANSTSLAEIAKLYNIELSVENSKIICPIPSHTRNGTRERSPSFHYYPETNSFYCFGCKACSKTVDFVAAMDNCSRYEAAEKILSNFQPNLDLLESVDYQNKNYKENADNLLAFSKMIRDYIKNNPDNLQIADEVCKVFDRMNYKYDLSPAVTTQLINKLSLKLGN